MPIHMYGVAFKKLFLARTLRFLLLAIICLLHAPACLAEGLREHAGAPPVAPAGEEFAGPLAGWIDARRDFGAVGDGRADDTTALQKALDALRPPDSPRRVLYIPAGIYRLTRTLHVTRTRHAESMDIMILGADPARTVLRWDGPAGGVMLDYGAWYARLGRLTLDGGGRAGVALAHGPDFVTYNELSDMVFRDAGIGIEAGHMDTAGIAETAVLRCRFERCTKAGVSLQNFNSLDWFLRDCRFEACALGVTNAFGAGNFHVYDSLFRHSSIADISIGNTGYFSLRNNTSLGSRAFFIAAGIGAGAGITLQGNTILDPQQTPIQIGNLGPVLLLDNVIRCRISPAARVNPAAGFLSMGNTFTVADAIQAKPSAPRIDDRLVAAASIKNVTPALPETPPYRLRPVIELAAGASASVLQQAIDTAAAQKGKRPVLHLPAAIYTIDHTLTIPTGSDVQVVGDGGKTVLRWSGSGAGPVLHVTGPSRAVLRDFTIDAGGTAEGLVIDRCDQPGARVFLEEANIRDGKQVGLRVEGVRNARVDLQDMNHSGCGIGVQVLGNGPAGEKANAPTRVVIWSGASSGNDLSYDVRNGGALLARDIWYEGASPGFMHCTDSGTFTLHGAEVAAGDPNHGGTGVGRPTIDLDGFRGRLTFLTAIFAAPTEQIVVHHGSAATKVLLIGQGNRDDFLVNQSPAAHAARIQSVKYTSGGGATSVADRGTVDAAFLREMLAQTRSARPHPRAPVPSGATDLQIYRLSVTNAIVCLRIRP
ncbi:MAG TPA: glycosyl hydrolase family 28-related protein [Chthonomonadaceae bacterium]|nr:glycosyl hydrolase family 28-related protein [Chthonomonadaceae bacterium]